MVGTGKPHAAGTEWAGLCVPRWSVANTATTTHHGREN